MTEAGVLVSLDEFSCFICVDLLNDPVTLPCGHSFCMNCINNRWDEDQMGVCNCPECSKTFKPRPDLCTNGVLVSLLEKIRTAGLGDDCCATTEDVECDICMGRKCKAVKSCLVCLASYCKVHFQPHDKSPALQKHTVIEATANLHEKICPRHGQLLEVFCRTDQKCVCCSCTLEEHCDHSTVSIAAERVTKEKEVVETQNSYKQRIQEREANHQMLVESIQRFKHSAQEAVENTEKMFHELIRSIEEKCSEVIEQIRAQEKTELGYAEEHLKQVKQEIDNLKRKDHELKQLTLMQDDILYLQVFQSLNGSSLPDSIPLANINTTYSSEDVNMFVCKLKEQIDNTVICPYSTSPCSIFAQQPEQICTPNVPDSRQDIINNPVTNPQFIFGNSSKPATECQPTFNFGFQSKPEPYFQPAPEFQTTFNFKGFSNTPNKFQFNFDSKSKAGTQAQIDPGHILKPPTFGFGIHSKSATKPQSASTSKTTTESQSIFGMSSKPVNESQSIFGMPFKTNTESPPAFGMSSKPATESQFSFGAPFKTNTESPPAFGMSSKPATESQFSFGAPFKTNTESPPAFGMSSKPATESQFSFGTPFKTNTVSPLVFGMSSKPATESQFSFEKLLKTNTESPPVFGMSSKPATEPKFSFGTLFKTTTESPAVFGMSSKPDTESKQ